MPSCPAPHKVAECQLYTSLSQLGDQGSMGPPRNPAGYCWWLSSQGDRKERDRGGEVSLGGSKESLKSQKMPEEDGDKQPLTPK